MKLNIRLPAPLSVYEDRAQFLALLQSRGGRIVQALANAPWITVDLSGVAISQASDWPGVLSIEEDQSCMNCRPQVISPPEIPAKVLAWPAHMVGLAAAHRITRGKGARVAVVDTGVAPHGALRGACITVQESFVPGENSIDLNGHGTAITGLVAAQGQILLGMAPEAEVFMLKALSRDGSGMWSWTAAALDRALTLRANVVVMALGGHGGSEMVADLLATLAESGAVPVAPTGNKGLERLDFPAFLPSTLAIAAVNWDGAVPSWSNGGGLTRSPDCAAPGARVPVLGLGNTYQIMSGTSMACGVAGGIMALAQSVRTIMEESRNGEALEQIRELIARTALALPEKANRVGAGIINAGGLVDECGEDRAMTKVSDDSTSVPILGVAGATLFLVLALAGKRGSK